MKPSLPCSILRQLMLALFLLSCLSGVRRSLYHALCLQFPQVSCQSLLVVVWSCVPGWLHLCGPVLVLQLPQLLLPLTPLSLSTGRLYLLTDVPVVLVLVEVGLLVPGLI